ncbi:MAG: hypothetical protein IJJ84_10100 [Kiritimatiellae bacterium]|nr:hypothetical protein [Kiritimatiellia bacterium]
MRKRTVAAFGAALAVAASATLPCAVMAAWPLVVVRYTGAINGDLPQFERLMAVHGEFPGSCDEVWLSAGGIKKIEGVAAGCAAYAAYRAACESNGVLLAYQQGRTLGHGPAHDGGTVPGNYTFPEDAWQVGVDGKRIKGVLCPRSPDVLAYERAFAHAVVAALHPASFWLDDDLRMGVSKPQGCFCARCLAAFNAKTGGGWTREALAAKLNGKAVREPVRAAWLDFNQESLALYAAAAREGAAAADPDCRMAYQSVWAETIYTGRDNRALLAALSGPEGRAVGIRPGAGCYTEAHPRDRVSKALSVAREAERCRDYGFVRNVCYEQETYPRRILQKSPGAIITEGTLALASGADSVSLYWYVGEKPEPLDEYRRGARAVAAARPCWERLSAVVRRTRLAGISRYVGSAAAEVAGFDLRDPVDMPLAFAGIPVTVAEAGYPLWYLTEKSRAEMTKDDFARAKDRTVEVPAALMKGPTPGYLRAAERAAFLDEIDRVTEGKFPVRLEECRPVRILPRVDAAGRLACVTLLNCSIGETDALTLRVRNPILPYAELVVPRAAPVKLACEPIDRPATPAGGPRLSRPAEWKVTLPSFAAWQIGVVFFEPAPTAGNGVTAHRGDSVRHPQNSLEAFAAAVDVGADWIETDVHFTSDKQLVIAHNHTTGEYSGKDRNLVIKDHTYAELAELDMAATFRARNKLTLEQCPKLRICRLDEALDLILSRRKSRLSIQPKCDCVDAVMALVRAKHAEAWVGFNDGNPAWMSRVKELDPTIPVFWDRGKCDLEKDISFAKRHGFETIVPNAKWVTPEVVRKLHAAGFQVGAWTVNDPGAMKRFLDMGVDRLYTDVPQQLLDVKAARPRR